MSANILTPSVNGIPVNVVTKDSSSNAIINNVIMPQNVVVSSSTPVNLTVANSQIIYVTGSIAQTLNAPNATTLNVGTRYIVKNRSTQTISFNLNSGTLLCSITLGMDVEFLLLSNGTQNGTWDINILTGDAIGTVKSYTATSTQIPTGYLLCNGSTYLRASYPLLFALHNTNLFSSQTFTVTIASPAVFTKTAHGFAGGERLRLSTTGALPTGLNTTTDYFVIFVSVNTFNLSLTPNGSAINTSGTQSGTHSYLQSLYGLGDGTTTANVPDYRGMFQRGSGTQTVSSVTYTSGVLGAVQSDDFKSHTHTTPNILGTIGNGWNVSGGGSFFTGPLTYTSNSTGGTETRPVNIAVNYIIKAS